MNSEERVIKSACVPKSRCKNSSTRYVKYVDSNGKQGNIRCDNKKEANKIIKKFIKARDKNNEYTLQDALDVQKRYRSKKANPFLQKSKKQQSNMTVAEMVEDYILFMIDNKEWSAGYISYRRSIFENYIKPNIGNIFVIDATPSVIDTYYRDIQKQKAAQGNNNKPQQLVSARTVHEIHKLLRPAFDRATSVHEIITINPTLAVRRPKIEKNKRDRWSCAELREANTLCTEEELEIKIYMGLLAECTRTGEIAALTRDCLFVSPSDIESGDARIYINKELARINKVDMDKLGDKDIYYRIPNIMKAAKTTLVIKCPKTEKSIREVYISKDLAIAIARYINILDEMIIKWGKKFQKYGDYDFVFVHPNGRPKFIDTMRKQYKEFIKRNGLREVDLYSLRHTGITATLSETKDMKSTQVDAGHAVGSNITNDVYADAERENRKNTAKARQKVFYDNPT